MCDIPLDLQRKFEQRWAARFAQPTPPVGSQKLKHEKQGQQLAAPAKNKRKTRGLNPAAGLRTAPVV